MIKRTVLVITLAAVVGATLPRNVAAITTARSGVLQR
jgi:hypothetical protein